MPFKKNPHDKALANAAAAVGISKVEENTNQEWKEAAKRAAISVARRKGTFTSDDVWEELTWDGVEWQPHNASAMGVIMKSLEDDGFAHRIKSPFGGYVKRPSIRETSHSRSVTVWESNVFYGRNTDAPPSE